MEYPSPETLRARNLPVLTTGDLFEADITEEERTQLDEYLAAFAMPKDGKCIRCGMELAGIMGALLGGFVWGIAHGEGHCGRCQWPHRAYHRPEAGPLESFTFILPYHPSGVFGKDEAKPNPTPAAEEKR